MKERTVLEHVLAGRASAERIRRERVHDFLAGRAVRAEKRKAEEAERSVALQRRRRERTEARRLARVSGGYRPAKREYLVAKYGCAWPGCTELQARYAHVWREPAHPDRRYGDAPLCKTHLHRAWATVEDFVEDVREAESHQELMAAASSDVAVAFEWRPIGRVDRTPTTRRPGSIYYLRCDGFIKIGYASDLVKRMRQYPPTIELLAARPGTKAEEAAEHSLLQEHRAWRREWYHPTPELLQHLAAVVERWGVDEICAPESPVVPT